MQHTTLAQSHEPGYWYAMTKLSVRDLTCQICAPCGSDKDTDRLWPIAGRERVQAWWKADHTPDGTQVSRLKKPASPGTHPLACWRWHCLQPSRPSNLLDPSTAVPLLLPAVPRHRHPQGTRRNPTSRQMLRHTGSSTMPLARADICLPAPPSAVQPARLDSPKAPPGSPSASS